MKRSRNLIEEFLRHYPQAPCRLWYLGNGEPQELSYPLYADSTVEWLDISTDRESGYIREAFILYF